MPVMPAVIYFVYNVSDVVINKTGAAAAERAKQEVVMVEMQVLGRSESVMSTADDVTFNALLFGDGGVKNVYSI